MATTAPTIELDLDADFGAVVDRAMAHAPAEAIRAMLAPQTCARAEASNRIFLRRHAIRRPGPGEGWSHTDHGGLIGDELARMGVPAEETAGCGQSDCPACNVVACGACCGLGCGPTG